MKSKRVSVVAGILLSLVSVVPAGSAGAGEERAPNRFMGVRVAAGGVISGDRIVYEGGDVVVVPEGAGDSFDSCPNGYVCLFEDVNWGGSLIQLSSCCAWNNLSAYGFDNLASSWRNRKNVDAQIATGSGGGGSRLCLNNNSYSSSMPGGWDNVASSLRVRDASTYC